MTKSDALGGAYGFSRWGWGASLTLAAVGAEVAARVPDDPIDNAMIEVHLGQAHDHEHAHSQSREWQRWWRRWVAAVGGGGTAAW